MAILDLSKAISRKRCKKIGIGGKLILITNRKSYNFYELSIGIEIGDLE